MYYDQNESLIKKNEIITEDDDDSNSSAILFFVFDTIVLDRWYISINI